MSNIVNANLKRKIEEFPEDIRDIAMDMIIDLNSGRKLEQSIMDKVERSINKILNEGKKNENNFIEAKEF